MMRLFGIIIVAVVAFELALASSGKEHSTAVRVRRIHPNQRILLSDNSRLFDIGKYYTKVKNGLEKNVFEAKSSWEKVKEAIRAPIYVVKGGIYGRRQQWDVKYGK